MEKFVQTNQLLSKESDEDEIDQDELQIIDAPEHIKEDQPVVITEKVEQTDDLVVSNRIKYNFWFVSV